MIDFVFDKFICGIGFDLTLEVVFKNLKYNIYIMEEQSSKLLGDTIAPRLI